MRALRTALLSLAATLATLVLTAACDDGTGTTGSSSSAGGAAASSVAETVGAGGAKPNLTPLLETAKFSVNCEPVVPADPVTGMFGAKYENAGELEGELDIVSAKILFTLNAKHLAWTIDVDPAASGVVPPGQETTVTHTKVEGSGVGDDPTMKPCDFCMGTAQLEVTWKSKQLEQTGKKSIGLVQCVQ